MGRHNEFDRTEVLESAAQVFWKKGYADTSISDLEKATGLNRTSIYHAFKDKDGLFVSSLQRYLEATGAVQLLMKEPLGWKNIEEFFQLISEPREVKGCFGGYCLREAEILPAEANRLVKEHFAALRNAFEVNLKADRFSNAGNKADIILTFLLGFLLEQNLATTRNVRATIQEFLSMLRDTSRKK